MNAETPIFPAAGDRPVTFNDHTQCYEWIAEIERDLIEVKRKIERVTSTPPKPVARVGDRIKIDDDVPYREVTSVDETYVWTEDLPWKSQDITDVYPAEEFAANSALVHYQRDAFADPGSIGSVLRREFAGTGISWFPGRIEDGVWAFLKPKAAAALGPFHPVPDRPIVAGDAVRDLTWCGGETVQHVQTVDHEIVTDCWRYPLDTSKLTHVAREDAAFIPPPAAPATKQPEPGTDDRPWKDWDPTINPATGERFEYEPAEPSTDYLAEQAERRRETEAFKDGSIFEWLEWPLITAGPGARHHFRREGNWWIPLHGGPQWSDDEIATLGDVRECVPVALPDEAARYISGEHWGVRDTVTGHHLPVRAARAFAAELLAAARAAERAGGAS